jgi:hypothetical protein
MVMDFCIILDSGIFLSQQIYTKKQLLAHNRKNILRFHLSVLSTNAKKVLQKLPLPTCKK